MHIHISDVVVLVCFVVIFKCFHHQTFSERLLVSDTRGIGSEGEVLNSQLLPILAVGIYLSSL